MQRVLLPAAMCETRLACLRWDGGANVLIRIEIDPIGLAHDGAELRLEVRQPMHPLDAAALRGLLFGELFTFPHGDGLVRLADEEHLALFRVRGIGEKHEDGLLLIDAAEVELVAVGDEGQGTIRIRG